MGGEGDYKLSKNNMNKERPIEEMEKRFDEKFSKLGYNIVELKDEYYIKSGVTADKIKSFLQSEIDLAVVEERKRLLKDMKKRMYHWHGTGYAMVDDYLSLITKEK